MENDQATHSVPTENHPTRGRVIRAKASAGAKFSFYIHLAAYVLVNLLLAFINLLATPLYPWCLWPILGWGFGLLIHALVAFSIPDLLGLRRRLYDKEIARELDR